MAATAAACARCGIVSHFKRRAGGGVYNKGVSTKKHAAVAPLVVDAEHAGQRLDNFLLREWRAAPKDLVYRLIRNGQVRVNGGRAGPQRRLAGGDVLRLPPRAPALAAPRKRKPPQPLELPPLYEDEHLLAVNKPAGLAAHGGSGVSYGAIERLRAARPQLPALELAHRLDKETSGVLLLAKKRDALRRLQAQWRARKVQKRYVVAVFGVWQQTRHASLRAPLLRQRRADGGNGRVMASADGKDARTSARLLQQWPGGALLEALIATGRTHQLRVHFADAGLPIVGDAKYGDFAANRQLCRAGGAALARMFLHAQSLAFAHPVGGERLVLRAPAPPEFEQLAQALQRPPSPPAP